MRLRLLSFMLLLAVSVEAPASDLYATIDRLRDGRSACDPGKRLPPLKPQAALERVASDLAQGDELEQSLQAQGYRAVHVSAQTFSGSGIDTRVAAILANPRYCKQWQDATVTEIGIYLDRQQVWIVTAAPFAPMVGIDAPAMRQRMLDLVNRARAQRRSCGNKAFAAARSIRWNNMLATASSVHATDMAQFNYFSHRGRDGSSAAQRVEQAGYRYRVTGENIAAGQMKAEDAVAAWIGSPTHCANLMNPAFTEMGVAFAVDRTSKFGVYWTQEFGAPR